MFQRINRTSDAKKDFRRVLEISPAYPRCHSRIAEVFLVEGDPEAALTKWAEMRKLALERVDRLKEEMATAGQIDLAMLSVATSELRSLV